MQLCTALVSIPFWVQTISQTTAMLGLSWELWQDSVSPLILQIHLHAIPQEPGCSYCHYCGQRRIATIVHRLCGFHELVVALWLEGDSWNPAYHVSYLHQVMAEFHGFNPNFILHPCTPYSARVNLESAPKLVELDRGFNSRRFTLIHGFFFKLFLLVIKRGFHYGLL